MKTEKEQLEEFVINNFINNYQIELRILKHSDKPDFTLFDKINNKKIGAEVTHLYYDGNEAKILLGRSDNKNSHGIMNFSNLINKLNELINQKCDKIKEFKHHDKFILIIRVASPIFDKFDFDRYEKDIIYPENKYSEIWIILDDNSKKQRWTELKQVK